MSPNLILSIISGIVCIVLIVVISTLTPITLTASQKKEKSIFEDFTAPKCKDGYNLFRQDKCLAQCRDGFVKSGNLCVRKCPEDSHHTVYNYCIPKPGKPGQSYQTEHYSPEQYQISQTTPN